MRRLCSCSAAPNSRLVSVPSNSLLVFHLHLLEKSRFEMFELEGTGETERQKRAK